MQTISNKRKRVDPIKSQFIVAAGLFLLLFLVYAIQTVGHQKQRSEEELTYINRLLAEGTRTTLIMQESRLRIIGNQLARLLGANDYSGARALIEEMQQIDDGMKGFGLARADGQLVMISGVPDGQALPNLMASEGTRDSFMLALNSRTVQMGRPYFIEVLESWVIPTRVAIVNDSDEVEWVMTSELSLDGGNTPWQLNLPRDVGVGMVRDDGYLQYASAVNSNSLPPESVRDFYGSALPESAIQQILAVDTSAQGIATFDFPRLGGRLLASVIRMPEYGLITIAASQIQVLYLRAIRSLVLPMTFLVAYLLASFFAYRYARRQQQRHDQRLVHLAHHDSLTNLPNRTLVLDRLRQAVAISVRRERSAALLFIDIDHFKAINDTYGHRFGDQLIRHVSHLFTEAIRPGDTVARLGGDEFLIVLPELVDDGDAKQVAERIMARFRDPMEIEDQQIHTSASIGIAVGPRDSEDPEELMRHADIALYDAKDHGRQCFSFFDSRLNELAQRRALLEKHLRQALDKQELSLVYQPVVSPSPRGSIRGMEALLRWHSDALGEVSPVEFIPVAEQAGLVADISRFVIYRAVSELAGLGEVAERLRVTVNVSAKDFREGHLQQTINRALQDAGLDTKRLVIELTESGMIEDLDRVRQQLAEIRALGIQVAVDDFGTGYSSLSYLNQLPVSILKIDRSFIRNLCDDDNDKALIRSIIAMGHGLGMLVVAEGVESEDQVDALSEMACDLLQGYYFSAPIPAAKIKEMLAGRQD